MTYDEIIEQLEVTKSKIKEIARNEYGGESWNDDLDALTEAADIVADYSKATAQASEMSQKYEQPAKRADVQQGFTSARFAVREYRLATRTVTGAERRSPGTEKHTQAVTYPHMGGKKHEKARRSSK